MRARISLSIVAKDEAAFLARAIRSAQDVVDEIVVVDTGSSDATPVIAGQCGARVFSEPWPNDFGAAYNLPLERCRGEWILSLDADEVLDPTDAPRVRELAHSGAADGYDVELRNYQAYPTAKWRLADPRDPLSRGALGYNPTRAVRLFRRRDHVRFEGLVHQSVDRSIAANGGVIQRSDLRIHHYGALRFDRASGKTAFYRELAQRKTRREPLNPNAWLELGLGLFNSNRGPAALDAFRRAEALGLRAPASYYAAITLLDMGQPAAAIDAALRALAATPADDHGDFDRADCWQLIGLAHETANRDRAAEDAYARALATRPWSLIALNNLASLRIVRGALRSAGELIDRLLELYPGVDMPWCTLGTLRLRQKAPKQARRAFQKALELNPENIPARINLGLSYEADGQLQEATEAYRGAWAHRAGASAETLDLTHLLPARPASRRPCALGEGGVVSVISHLGGGGGRVLVDAALALSGRPQVVICADAGAHTGQGLQSVLQAAGIEIRTAASGEHLRGLLRDLRPRVVLHHWWDQPVFVGATRANEERWIAIGHAPLPMPLGYDAYVVLSEFHARFQSHLPTDRVVRIPNGVDPSRFTRAPSTRPVTIAMLSRLDPGKFPRRLLDYLPPLDKSGARLLIAGRGTRRLEIEPELASRRGLGTVQFVGPIRTEQVPGFLGRADVGLHLTETHEEICSMSILEMLAAGLPIVAEPKGCLPEMIEHGRNGFLADGEREVAQALERLIGSSELRRSMGRESRQVAQAYDLERYRQAMQKLVDDVARGPAYRPGWIEAPWALGRGDFDRPRISYLVCATPRCGSGLLCEALINTGLAGFPSEFFTPVYLRELAAGWGVQSFPAFLETLFAHQSTPNGVFGAKLMLPQVVHILRQLGVPPERHPFDPLRELFGDLRFVFLTRRDKLRQAISHVRAVQSGTWFRLDGEPQDSGGCESYDRKAIEASLAEIVSVERSWRALFADADSEPITVDYETLVDHCAETAERVLRELGVEVPDRLPLGRRRMLKQADAITEEWIERFGRTESNR